MFMVIIVVVIIVPPKANDSNKHTSSGTQIKTDEEEGLEQYGEFFDEHYFWP